MNGAGKLTGRKMAWIAGLSFALVLAVNVLLAYVAVHTFSGEVVEDSYVASRSFDAEREAQIALGWTLELIADGTGLRLDVIDAAHHPVRPAAIQVIVGRPSTDQQDQTLVLQETARGYAAAVPLAPGAWRVEVTATARDGTAFRQSRQVYVEAGS